MICGPGRAGKSSLIDSLKNKPISKKKDSTQGVSLSKVTCHITHKDGKSHWPEETDKKTHQQLFLAESLSSALDSHSHAPASSELGQPDENHDNGTSKHHTSSQHGQKKLRSRLSTKVLELPMVGLNMIKALKRITNTKLSKRVHSNSSQPEKLSKNLVPSCQEKRSTFSTSGISVAKSVCFLAPHAS